MAIIQFVGFPMITPYSIVKYGYIPKLNGEVVWYVTERNRQNGGFILLRADNAVQARETAEKLIEGENKVVASILRDNQ